MTRAAVIMLLCTWSVIAYFTGRYFWKVLRTPQKMDGDD
jgi:hypothetical protein